jgi:MraZ protein
MLLGTHRPRLDDKGRLVLPAKLREALADGIVLTKGQDRCVVLWPAAEFARHAERLDEASRSSAATRAYLRVLFSSAFDQVPDKQGRISVPAGLREYAALEGDVVVAGNGGTCELWEPDAWDAYLAEQERAFSGLDEEVMPGLLR